MHRISLVALMVALVAAVLAASVWTMRRAERAALGELRQAQERLAQETATSLNGYLESLDRDTRLLASLASGTRRQPIDERIQDAAILDAFQALATVVPHYRTIALFRGGHEPIVAVDPTEDRLRIAPALVAASRTLANQTTAQVKASRAGPLTLTPGRFFYLYSAPAGAGESVVVTSDAALMLEAVSRGPMDAQGLVVVDPSGAAWIGCEQRQRCKLVPARSDVAAELIETIASGTRNQPPSARPGDFRLGLPTRVIVGVAPQQTTPLGVWSVAVIAPAANLDLRQRGFLWQLVITSIGVALAMLAVGILILRQHANAAELRARLQAAEEVARLQRQLVRAEKLVTVGVLSAGIAHEIGTPLAVVRGRAEHMLERRFEKRDMEDLRAVVAEIDRISSTIRQVLEFSRDEAITVGTIDARCAITRALELLAWRLAGKRLVVDVDAPGDLPSLAAAADQLEQVLVNLLLNACDASKPEGSIRITVAVDDKHKDRLRIEVADRGGGIPPHHLNAVFDPYFTTKRRGEGTGLGLAIVWQIVRSHRGEIALRSTVGVGTVATLTWPVAADSEEGREKVA